MCGIAGFAGPVPASGRDPARLLAAMCTAIRHRGPDGEGFLVEPPVALGMRRLSIIDLEGGWQPIGNEDGTIQVVFNGEIYNFRALRAELERLGHTFRTRSDTETIVHGYEQWGDGVLEHLRGMFAIALWDRPRQRLLLARDRFGIKPLYLWPRPGGVAFASELKSLELLPEFPTTPDGTALLRYLALGYVPDPLCIWQGVRKLAPGHLATWSPDQELAEREWWSPLVPERTTISEGEAREEIARLLEDAVRCHLESDVPLGAFLSGGVDSSAVVAQMARLATGRVRTFSIGFSEAAFNEAPHAARVAAALGTDHTERVLTPDIDGLVEELVLGFDEPFADSSALPTWLVSKLAREQVTVALSGDGGDELFGGYTRYQEVRDGGITNPMVRRAMGWVGRHLPHGARGRQYLLNQGRGPIGRYASTVGLPALIEEGGVVRAELAGQEARLEHLLATVFEATAGRDLSARMALVDVLSYLPGDILTKVDRMSMRVSLEARVPLLDHPFAEFALSLPTRLKFRDGVGKWIFREAIRPLVPAPVLEKPKQGFGVPIVDWLRGPLRHRVAALRAADSPIYSWCDRAATHRILDEHHRGRRDHSTQIWRLLVLHLWLGAHSQ
jgi:asparagine synthase (glutamine-hydrolysing)